MADSFSYSKLLFADLRQEEICSEHLGDDWNEQFQVCGGSSGSDVCVVSVR
jgi:hypothetical protein